MKVWVIMGNDFPDCVFAAEEAAAAYIKAKEADEAKQREKGFGRIYWRSYAYEVRE